MSEHEHDGIEHTHDDDDDREGILAAADAAAADDSGVEGESSDSVEPPAPKRQVPVIIEGVNHGMRDADEGE